MPPHDQPSDAAGCDDRSTPWIDSDAVGWSLPDTILTMLRQIQQGDQAAIRRFFCRYATPAFCYLRTFGCDREKAKDLTMEALERLLTGMPLGHFDPSKGRFRPYLKRVLANTFISKIRHDHAVGRHPAGGLLEFDRLFEEHGEGWVPADDETPEEAFDRQFAYSLLNVAIDRVEDECKRDNLTVHFTIFADMYLKPHEGDRSPSLSQVARRHGLTRDQARPMVGMVLGQVGNALRDELKATGLSDAEVDEEVRELIEAIRRRSRRTF